MIIHLYKDSTIAIPLKHGSRFVREHHFKHFGEFEETSMRERDIWLPFVKYIVLRDPVEHLKTALHTEIMEDYDLDDRDGIEFLLYNHYYKPHFGNHYDIELSKSLYESGFDFKIVPLNDLSKFLYCETGSFNKAYDAKDWIPKKNTPLGMSREEFWYEFSKRYPKQSLELIELALKDREYYNKMIKERKYKNKFV